MSKDFHTAEAERLLVHVKQHNGGNMSVSDAIAVAQVHATLALVARLAGQAAGYQIDEMP